MKLKDLVKLKPIIEAIEQGKTIQFKNVDAWYSVDYEDTWFSIHGLMYGEIEWRIKPEPREWHELEYADGEPCCNERYKTREDAEHRKSFTVCKSHVKIIKVREVIE